MSNDVVEGIIYPARYVAWIIACEEYSASLITDDKFIRLVVPGDNVHRDEFFFLTVKTSVQIHRILLKTFTAKIRKKNEYSVPLR